ncbi:MAG: UPF0104 family protein [Chloroflexi bacterium]|nr:MAG: UPF0104 family protein [Chloroflexota bacterium]
MRHWRIGTLGLVVSLVAVYFMVSEIDFKLLGQAIEQARWVYIVPCVVLLLVGLITRGLRWQLLLNHALPFWRAFHIMNVAYLVNGVLPLRIGEIARMYLATRAQPPVPVFQTASTIIIERLLDLLGVVMLLALALTVSPLPVELQSVGLLMGIAAPMGFVVAVVLSRKRGVSHRVLVFLTARMPFLKRFDLVTWLDQFLDGLEPLAQLRTLFFALFWTALSWGFSVLAGYVLMYTFYDEASWAATALYIAAAAFAIAVPATLASLGVYEGAIVLALQAFEYGEPAAVAVAFAVTVHFVNVFVHSITGVIGFIAEGITIEQLSAGVENARQEMKVGHESR